LSTATIKIYQNGTSYLIAVRGTADARDVASWASVAANKLSGKDRYKEDYKIVTDFVAKHPSPPASYYLTGHSLGSAIALQLRRDIPALNVAPGTAFNGALQPIDLLKPDARFHEVYASRDPLYLAEGHFYRNHEVKENPSLKPPSKWNLIAQAADKLANHKLSFFSSILGGSAWLHPSYARGGALAKAEAKPLSDSDLSTLLPGIKITSYPQLASMQSIDDVLDSKGRGIILILTTGPNDGHWVGLLKSPAHKTIEYFDSYGNAPDYDLEHWISPHKRAQLKENAPYLTQLLDKAQDNSDDIVWNRTKFQKDGGSISTCGRHVAARLLNADETLPVYTAMVRQSGMPPDEFVTVLTDKMLAESRAPRGAYASGGARKRRREENMEEKEQEDGTPDQQLAEATLQQPDYVRIPLHAPPILDNETTAPHEEVLQKSSSEEGAPAWDIYENRRSAATFADIAARRQQKHDYMIALGDKVNRIEQLNDNALYWEDRLEEADRNVEIARRNRAPQWDIDSLMFYRDNVERTYLEADTALYEAEKAAGGTYRTLLGKYEELQAVHPPEEEYDASIEAHRKAYSTFFPRNVRVLQGYRQKTENKIRRLHESDSFSEYDKQEADKALRRIDQRLKEEHLGKDSKKMASTITRLPEDVRGLIAEYTGAFVPKEKLGEQFHDPERPIQEAFSQGIKLPPNFEAIEHRHVLDPSIHTHTLQQMREAVTVRAQWMNQMLHNYRPALITFMNAWNAFVDANLRIPTPAELPRPWGGAGGGKPHLINTDAVGYDHIPPRPINSEYFHRHMPNVYLAQGIY